MVSRYRTTAAGRAAAKAQKAVEKLRLDLPLDVFLSESEGVAAAFMRHRKRLLTATGGALAATLGDDILRLVGDVRASMRARSTPVHRDDSAIERASEQIREIRGVVRFAAALHGTPDLLRRLAKLVRKDYLGSRTPTILAAVLDPYAGFVREYRATFDGLGGFSVAKPTDTAKLVKELLDLSTARRSAGETRREDTRARNKLVAELRDRVRAVRTAARFVFRAEPEIIREFTSALGRKRRRLARAAPKKAPAPGGDMPSATAQNSTPAKASAADGAVATTQVTKTTRKPARSERS